MVLFKFSFDHSKNIHVTLEDQYTAPLGLNSFLTKNKIDILRPVYLVYIFNECIWTSIVICFEYIFIVILITNVKIIQSFYSSSIIKL